MGGSYPGQPFAVAAGAGLLPVTFGFSARGEECLTKADGRKPLFSEETRGFRGFGREGGGQRGRAEEALPVGSRI